MCPRAVTESRMRELYRAAGSHLMPANKPPAIRRVLEGDDLAAEREYERRRRQANPRAFPAPSPEDVRIAREHALHAGLRPENRREHRERYPAGALHVRERGHGELTPYWLDRLYPRGWRD